MNGPLMPLMIVTLAALFGSIPFGLLIARAWSGADVRTVGSGNIGATNVLRASGPAPAILTLLLDIAKGAGAVLIARAAMVGAHSQIVASGTLATEGMRGGLLAAPGLEAWAALAAVTGHMFSPWLRFRGGKGVATAAGAVLALSPALAASGFAVFLIVFAMTRTVSLASISACLAVIVVSGAGLIPDGPSFLIVAGICALIVFRHRANLSRLLKGQEPKLHMRRNR